MSKSDDLLSLLMDIEAELRRLQLWQAESPSPEALASSQPFCVDTLTFAQWLQFVLLVKMRRLLEQQLPLPGNCQIAPMAEEYFRATALDAAALIALLQRFDRCLSH